MKARQSIHVLRFEGAGCSCSLRLALVKDVLTYVGGTFLVLPINPLGLSNHSATISKRIKRLKTVL